MVLNDYLSVFHTCAKLRKNESNVMQKSSLFCVHCRVAVTSVESELLKKVDFRKQFWKINATKCIDKGISRKNEAIQSEGSTQIWEDCGKS